MFVYPLSESLLADVEVVLVAPVLVAGGVQEDEAEDVDVPQSVHASQETRSVQERLSGPRPTCMPPHTWPMMKVTTVRAAVRRVVTMRNLTLQTMLRLSSRLMLDMWEKVAVLLMLVKTFQIM